MFPDLDPPVISNIIYMFQNEDYSSACTRTLMNYCRKKCQIAVS
jgi:hypothetical protein